MEKGGLGSGAKQKQLAKRKRQIRKTAEDRAAPSHSILLLFNFPFRVEGESERGLRVWGRQNKSRNGRGEEEKRREVDQRPIPVFVLVLTLT